MATRTSCTRSLALNRLRETHGMDDGAIAIVFGVSAQTVRGMSALLGCTAAVRKAVDSGQINATHAIKLSKLEPTEQREKVQELIAAGEGSNGHAKARKQRAVIDPTPKMRSRAEVAAAYADAVGEHKTALAWVLRHEDQP